MGVGCEGFSSKQAHAFTPLNSTTYSSHFMMCNSQNQAKKLVVILREESVEK